MKLLNACAVLRNLLVALGVAAAAGCRTIPPPGVEAFSTGVTAAKTQTHLALVTIANMSRAASVQFAAQRPTLNATNLVSSPDPEIIASWDRIFSPIERYSQQLASLVSPDAAKEFTESAVGLAAQFRETSDKLKKESLLATAPEISPQLATAFTKVGEAILRMRAQAEAKRIAAATDPEVQKIFVTLADVIGDAQTKHLRGSVRAHWQNLEAPLQSQFLRTTDPNEKRQIVQRFADLLEKQDEQDLSLDSLRRSLLALADAHHALAQGQAGSLRSAVGIVGEELARTKALYDEFKSKLNK